MNVNGGTLSVTAADGGAARIYVGDTGGTGTLNVGGIGTVTTGSDLVLGSNGGTGTLNQTAGTINAGGWAYVGGAMRGLQSTRVPSISAAALSIRAMVASTSASAPATPSGT